MSNIYTNMMFTTIVAGSSGTASHEEDFEEEEDYDDYGDVFELDELNDERLVTTRCQACAKDQAHTIIKQAPNMRVQCNVCSTVQVYTPKPPVKTTKVKVIISKKDISQVHYIDLPFDETVDIGTELLVDDRGADEVNYVEITDIELPGKRVLSARSDEIVTIWARAIDKVYVKFSINKGNITEAQGKWVEGNHEYVVGDNVDIGRNRYVIKSIKIRDGSFRRRVGDLVPAKDAKRIFVRAPKPAPRERKWNARVQDGTW